MDNVMRWTGPAMQAHPNGGFVGIGDYRQVLRDAEELANALRDVLAGHPVLNADELIARYSPLSPT